MVVMEQTLQYLQKNWFKVLILMALAYVVTKKNFSFQLGMDESKQQEAPTAKPPAPRQAKEGYTVKTPPQKQDQNVFAIDPLGVSPAGAPFERTSAEAFIKRFAKVAVAEKHKFGIPASLILAHALWYAQAGQNPAVGSANNIFQLACSPDWRGPSLQQDGRCLRQYPSAWMSFRDHSYYLTTGTFSPMREVSVNDLKGWIKGLQQLGFYRSNAEAKQMEKLIDEFSLQTWDNH
jgi:hypothetical protein